MMSKQFDLEELKAFVASKPRDEEYAGYNSRVCALAKFGFPDVVNSRDRARHGISEDAYFAAVYSASRHAFADKPAGWSTFGALADRLARLTEPLAKATHNGEDA